MLGKRLEVLSIAIASAQTDFEAYLGVNEEDWHG